MGYMYVPLLRHFSHPPGCSIRLHFRVFQFLKTLFLPEITNCWKTCISKSQNWGKVHFLSLKFSQISVPRASIWTKKKNYDPKFDTSPFSKPLFLALWVAHPYQNEGEDPLSFAHFFSNHS